jgi:acyl carrier protein
MEKKKIQDIIIKLINKIKPIEKKYKKNINKFDFMSSGHIDSIEILKFNFEIEDKFNISIKPNESVKKSYRTIGGLSSMIERKLSKKFK